jgi:hypothetical protein
MLSFHYPLSAHKAIHDYLPEMTLSSAAKMYVPVRDSKREKMAVKIATMLPGPVYARLWKLPRLKTSALEACIENVPPKDKRHARKSQTFSVSEILF